MRISAAWEHSVFSYSLKTLSDLEHGARLLQLGMPQKGIAQQNLGGLRIAIIVLSSTSWPRIEKAASAVKEAIDAALPGILKK